MVDEENLIKIKLFFYCDDKKLKAQLFTDEWYTIVADEFGEDQVSPEFQPWLEFHVHDFATFGEMLLSGIAEANRRFEEMQSEMRFLSNIDGGEDVYDVYMAKKKSGKPKDGEPNWELNQKVNSAGVQDNLFTVVYTSLAVERLGDDQDHNK